MNARTPGSRVRLAAWRVLRSGSATPLRSVERVAERLGLDARDRALLRRIVGCEVRRRASLRAISAALGGGALSPDAAAFAHVGLAQLLFLEKVPQHAAIAETARACGAVLGEGRGRRVRDLLLRGAKFRREGVSGDPLRDLVGAPWHFERPLFRDPREHPYLWAEDALSMPAPIVKRWAKRHGQERAFALARTFLEPPDLSLVVAGDRDAARTELEAHGIVCRDGAHARVLLAASGDTAALLRSAAFREGRVTVQGESALRAAELVQPLTGEVLADLCAAPGGKSAVLAASGARVIAADRNPRRLARARETLSRVARVTMPLLLACDGGTALARETFDGVLVDAPCSNTGVLGARPEARWRFGPALRDSLARVQARLIAEGAALVRRGGRLVWSTCSLEPEENGQLVRAFLAAHPEWSLEAEESALPAPPGSAGPIDGGYAVRLRLG